MKLDLLPRSLTARLVVTAVALVALVGVLVGVSATLAMRSYLYDKRDGEVSDALRRAAGFRAMANGPDLLAGVPPLQPGAVAVVTLPRVSDSPIGLIVPRAVSTGDVIRGGYSRLPARTVEALEDVPADGQAHQVEIAGTGYRVMATADAAGGPTIIGLDTEDIDDTLSNMVTWFVLLTLLGVLAAGGAGSWLVRRQLRPLHDVAEAAREVTTQDLSSGDTAISTRVPAVLTDPGTEVGQVGSALNTLLDHVDGALAARHRSEQQVRQFVADASHELRTPLSTIHGYAELSRRTPEDPAALAAALDKVETEAGRMSGLVEDLLLLARLDSGRPLASDEVDLTKLLLEAVADARVLAPGHHWRLDLPGEPVLVVGDAARLHQAATNLLSNARSHTPAGTTVTVSASAAATGARFSVHDDGPGLSPELVGEAFDRFTRGDSSRTRASGGAGLGLSLVSAIATAHGGTASVASAPGDTTFTVELPVVEPVETGPAADRPT